MSKKEEKVLSDINDVITKYQEEKKEKQKPKQTVTITAEELQKFINQNKQQPDISIQEQPMQQEMLQSMQQQPQTSTISKDERRQLAFQIYKDAKAVSIVCLLTITFLMITIFVTMFDPMFAMITALMGMIYPIFIFIRMIRLQTRAYHKYGWKPLFHFPQQQPPMQNQTFNQNQPRQKQGGGFF